MMKRFKIGWKSLLILIWSISLVASPSVVLSESTSQIFSTWDIFEVDKLASIWLIKRFIDPNAEIKLYPRGDAIAEGIPFDTPDAKFRRYHNASTYETLRRHYKINHPQCLYISKIVHDIEINTWERKRMPESRRVMNVINNIMTSSSSADEIIERGMSFFDKLFSS